MSSLADEFAAEQNHEKRCGLKDALRSMEKEEKEQAIEALHDLSVYGTTITAVLKKRGYKVNQWQVRHCRSDCECGEI